MCAAAVSVSGLRGMERGQDQPPYMTLYTALVTVAKMAAPMVPFMSEEIYRNLVCSVDKTAPESVHLCAVSGI